MRGVKPRRASLAALASKRRASYAGVVAAAFVTIALAGAVTASGHDHSGATRATVIVSVHTSRPGPRLPADFVGLSYEVKQLPLIASLANRGNYVTLLRSIGPGTLRFGGVTADSQVAWLDPASQQLPAWATSALTPGDLQALGQLTRASGWNVVLTVNLDHFDPGSAADEAAVAQRELGTALRGVEIGNEPSAYVAEHLRAGPYSFATYRRQVDAYIAAIHARVPGLPIYGPDNEARSSKPSNFRWAQGEAREIRPAALTAHLYGTSKCRRVPQTIPFLLSPGVRAKDDLDIRKLEAVAGRYQLPVWLDETNNAACGGEPGVSNTFAGALWAVGLLARVLKAPFVGAAFHGFLTNPDGYTPIAAESATALASGQLTAEPEWYALLLAHQVARDRPVPVRLSRAVPGLAVWAGLSPAGSLQIIALNQTLSPRARVNLKVRARGGQVMTLTASTPSATSGILLGGASVRADGSWQGKFSAVAAHASTPDITVAVPSASAVLIEARQ